MVTTPINRRPGVSQSEEAQLPTGAKCVTCSGMFSGSRQEAFQWLRYHRTLHELQATAIQRLTASNPASRAA